MLNLQYKKLFIFLIILISFVCSSCAAVKNYRIDQHKQDLTQILTNISDPIFLEPIPKENKIIYIEYKNISGNANINFKNKIIDGFKKKGFLVLNEYEEIMQNKPHIILQISLNYAALSNRIKSKQAKGKDIFNNTITGLLVGGTTGFFTDKNNILISLCGGLAGFLFTKFLYQDQSEYLMIVDLKISQNTKNPICSDNIVTINSGIDGKEYLKWQENKYWKSYRTKIEKTIKIKGSIKNKMQLLQESMINAILDMI
ncbi:MAG: complement resistance protein TraT [Rickettsiales bacterium]